MTWLAIDSSGTSGSIALEQDGVLLYQCYFNIDITHSETLMPQVDTALRFCQLSPSDLSGIITTLGPGSFTGLRIGLATAKGLAYGRKIPLLAYSSLELVAANYYGSEFHILVCQDAKMQEIYSALYTPALEPIIHPHAIKPENLVAKLDVPVILAGNYAHQMLPKLIAQHLEVRIGLPHQDIPLAGALFSLRKLKPQPEVYDFNAIANLEPKYLRESTAQIKLNQKKINA